ncbi:MAG: 2-hydroxyacyl-CoA dehydratase subunit D [Candidatus Syntropharchaeia archaeon]
MIEKLRKIVSERRRIAEKWKGDERKVIGWICPYVPEEIIHAAGMLPFRITGDSSEIVRADGYLYPNICSYNRAALELALKGGYDFLDGVVTGNICDHIRRLYDVWTFYLELPFKKVLSVPHKVSDRALKHFSSQLLDFRKELEDVFGVEISDDSLRDSIKIYNRTRILLRKLYDMRKGEEVPISGSEVVDVVKTSMAIRKEDYNPILEELIEELEGREPFKRNVRLMISGSDLDNPEYVKLIEESGGLVVCDDLCTGSRYFLKDVDEEGNPIENLSKRYLSPRLCARMPHGSERAKDLIKMAEDFSVNGVILEALKFCDLYGCDIPMIKGVFEEVGIPVLMLDREYIMKYAEFIAEFFGEAMNA